MKAGHKLQTKEKTSFSVWAPLKDSMLLHIVHPGEQKIKMTRNESGYFIVEANVGAGCRYFFMPDGKGDIPDPASLFQPEGVHGPSEVIDHSAHEWNDKDWKGLPFDELILYELHVGTFTTEGTFEAAIGKLDHLISTGVNAIELMPIGQFPGGRNWGYDGVFPYAVQNSYGGPEGLKNLVEACHQKGIAVFLDVVYNHLGPEGNYFGSFGPYFTDRYKSLWGTALNFDGPWSDGVRDYFTDNPVYWFEHFHIDGLRFDAIHGVFDMGAVHLWQLMHQKIHHAEQKLGRKLHTIAESDLNDPRVLQPIEMNGFGFTAQWLDDFHHALYTLVDIEQGKVLYADFGDIRQLAKAYKEGFVHSGDYVNFRKRKYGASSAGINGDRFVIFIDNHDQAGNRATGACLASLITFEKIKLAAAANLLAPYVPMLFMGEEYGDEAPFLYFVSHSDKELNDGVREGRKKEFEHLKWSTEPPDPVTEQSFIDSKLRWGLLNDERHGKLLQWYKKLIALRKTRPALRNFDKNDCWVNTSGELLQLNRRSQGEDEELICLFNFSESPSSISMPLHRSNWEKLLDSNEDEWSLTENRHMPMAASVSKGQVLTVPSLTAAIYCHVE